jgi:FkbM family methyltransferase
MLDRLKSEGKLYGFEPNIEIFGKLKENLTVLNHFSTSIHLFKEALSDTKGSSFLSVPEFFGGNNGISFLKSEGGEGTYEVPTDTLDNLIPRAPVKLLKMDVEGHELGVLKGAKNLLSEGLIQYVLFEDQPPFPSAVFELLTKYGYSIWKLAKTNRGLLLVKPENTEYDLFYEPFNFVALKDESLVNQINSFPDWKFYKNSK